MVIAIDGPAGSGKSTISKILAERLGFAYINSGKFYRALTLFCLRNAINFSNIAEVEKKAGQAKIQWLDGEIFLEGENVDKLLQTDEIDAEVAKLSKIVSLRHKVNKIFRELAQTQDLVVEGRDMTTVVFPDAKFLFYLDASPESRAKRRYSQGVSGLSYEEILQTILERDEIDRNKVEGSLKISEQAVYLDTSHLTIEAVYEKLVQKIQTEGSIMDQMEVEKNDVKVMDDNILTQLQEESLKSYGQVEEGQVVEGVVIQVNQDQVFIDVGLKSEGKLPLTEFKETPEIGEKVSVVVVQKEGRNGQITISKQKADIKAFWKLLRQAFQDHQSVEGIIEKAIKGGYEVNLGSGIRAFLPASQSDSQKIEKPEKLVNVKSKFYIERLYSDNKVNVVVNRRRWLEEEVEKIRESFYADTQIGDEITGTVKSFTSFGAFIDLGGFDGLLHINDMSWGHVTRPKDFVKKGQEIKLKVIRIDQEEKRINLSLKHFTNDPWVHFEDKYHVNDIAKGQVTKLTDFGAFIELEEGIEGLAHISEFSWVKKIQKPEEVLSIGDEVECMILGYDLQAGRVSLGLKQVTANPWTEVAEKYPVGTRLTRPVVKLTNAGAFIQIEEGIDGFLHVDDLSWTKKVKYPGSELQVGQEIECIVISIEPENRSLRLGVKQLTDDPWLSFAETYKVGNTIEGEVSSITDFGIFIRVPGGIEGLIHKSNLAESREETADEALAKFSVGDKIKAVVLDIQADKQKVAFSIRDYSKKLQREEISRYMAEDETDNGTFTFGDIYKSKGDQ